ncbi:MAG: aspartate aminotransferase family protein [Bryobacteraceae bacterium]
MYVALKQEVDTYEKRTPLSRQAHARASARVPLGVGSNYRFYPPYPLFVRDATGVRIHDLDGNQYIDHNLCYGALIAGHCHPAVMRAIEARLHLGTLYGMPHGLELELAEEICARFPVEMLRFTNSGGEATMSALRLARAVTGREKTIKMEGGYHGGHDAVSVSVKPSSSAFGDPEAPNTVAGSAGVLQATIDQTIVAPFNNLKAIERIFERNPGTVAAVILEPIMMNIVFVTPDVGYLRTLRELTKRHGALLIFDEVKTGAKLCYGGASEYFQVKPDIICLGKSIGGGVPLAAFGASKQIMNLIAEQTVYHAGTYNTNPLAMAAGLAMFREVLKPEIYPYINALESRLVEGYRKIIEKSGLVAYADGAGANGALCLYPKRIRNYRDWYEHDSDLWMQYWFGMANRGVIPQPFWHDEQWTLSVQHTEADIDLHLAAFADIAPALALAQEERQAIPAHTA